MKWFFLIFPWIEGALWFGERNDEVEVIASLRRACHGEFPWWACIALSAFNRYVMTINISFLSCSFF